MTWQDYPSLKEGESRGILVFICKSLSWIKVSLLWPGACQWRIYYHRICGQLSTTCSNLLKYPNGELLVAVDHNQLRTMASETVYLIDWSHPPLSWAVPPGRFVHSINRCSSATAGIRSCNLQHAKQPPCLCGHSGYEEIVILKKYLCEMKCINCVLNSSDSYL